MVRTLYSEIPQAATCTKLRGRWLIFLNLGVHPVENTEEFEGTAQTEQFEGFSCRYVLNSLDVAELIGQMKPETLLAISNEEITALLSIIGVEEDVEAWKTIRSAQIHAYDNSDNVNAFLYNGVPMWIDKETRVGLMNSTSIERMAERITTKFWFGGTEFIFPIDAFQQMLAALELYALNCYNVTARHAASVASISTLEDIKAYDFTINYPDKLQF